MVLGALIMLLGLRLIPGADWNFTRAFNLDILTRDKNMAIIDRQIDDASAMTRGKKEYSTVHFIEAVLLRLLTHRPTVCSGLLSELKAARGEHKNRKGKPSSCLGNQVRMATSANQ